jgi:hypothetical protein
MLRGQFYLQGFTSVPRIYAYSTAVYAVAMVLSKGASEIRFIIMLQRAQPCVRTGSCLSLHLTSCDVCYCHTIILLCMCLVTSVGALMGFVEDHIVRSCRVPAAGRGWQWVRINQWLGPGGLGFGV